MIQYNWIRKKVLSLELEDKMFFHHWNMVILISIVLFQNNQNQNMINIHYSYRQFQFQLLNKNKNNEYQAYADRQVNSLKRKRIHVRITIEMIRRNASQVHFSNNRIIELQIQKRRHSLNVSNVSEYNGTNALIASRKIWWHFNAFLMRTRCTSATDAIVTTIYFSI